jgi:hypothetical protein
MKRTFAIVVMALGLAAAAGCGEKKAEEKGTGQKVQLEFFIMSKCPFGVKVMQAITPVLEKMGTNVDFKVDYIGREKDGELTSMHGDPEVKGNIIQMCARDVGSFEAWLAFVKCQNEDWRKIPEGWEKCAETAKLDVAKVKSCSEGDKGKELLRASFKRAEEKKATGSPTIFMAGEPYKGGRSESSFGRAICDKFTENKPKYCADIPAPIKVPVTVVGDKRCTSRSCDTKRFLAFITNTFEGAEVKELDYADAEGKALFGKTGEKFLPVAVFGAAVEKEESGYNRLKRRLKKIEGSDEFVYPLGRDWDPAAEICDDGVDNTGDGKVDCDDDTCKGKKVCREEIKNKVSVFVMSQCPYGVRTVDAMDEVIKNFGKDRKKMDFGIEFIGKNVDGKLNSMHGQGEVDENLRQVCAQKYYAKDYKFMEYVLCRNKAYQETRGKEPTGTEWTACAKAGIKADVIKKCAEGEEGTQLLSASFKLAEDLGITGSPGWLLNNKFDMRGRTSDAIKSEFCAKNEGIAECANKLSSGEGEAPVPSGSCGGGGGPSPIEIRKGGEPPAGGPPMMGPGPGGPGVPVPPGPPPPAKPQ